MKFNIKVLLNAIIYLILFILFLKFYLIQEVTEFLDGKTTFISSFEKAQETEFPTILACFSPPFKTKRGKSLTLAFPKNEKEDESETYEDYYDYGYEEDGELDEDVLKSFMKMTYHHDTDYHTIIKMYNQQHKKITSKTKIEYFATLENGLCMKLTFNQYLQKVRKLSLEFTFNDTERKKPKQLDLFIASNNSWQGLILNRWPFFEVEQISLNIKNNTKLTAGVGIKPTLLEFAQGFEDFSLCLDEALMDIKIFCLPLIYHEISNLTFCKDGNDIRSALEQISEADEIMNCFKPKSTYLFKALRPSFDEKSFEDGSKVKINIYPYSSTLEVRKEILVLDASTFIGSIGGSLGLFLGFSIFSYLSGMIDWVSTKLF